MARLQDKVAVITGGSGGIGRAAGTLFVQEGARVLLVDVDEGALQEAMQVAGADEQRVGYVVADVTQPQQVEAALHEAVSRFGGLDIVVANAGIEGQVQRIEAYEIDVFRQVIEINVLGTFYTLRYAFPHLRERGGSVIVTASVAGVAGSPMLSAYVTSKHAVIGLMRAAAVEGAEYRIRVNSVNPAPIETRMMRSIEAGMGDAERMKAQMAGAIPLKRYGEPEEVAQLMLFLASDESAYITGSVHMIDGGLTAL
jgi:NAD(P)-dependent dehydrogenase (short-subunit alcohol dehydrogenase family)